MSDQIKTTLQEIVDQLNELTPDGLHLSCHDAVMLRQRLLQVDKEFAAMVRECDRLRAGLSARGDARTMIATAVLNGLISYSPTDPVETAVKYADALIDALAKETK